MPGTLAPGVAQGVILSSSSAVTALLREVLPELDVNGDLPAGIHEATWTQVEERFGRGTHARVRALATLRQLGDLAERTGCLGKFYVFGSFVSSTPEPRDVDVILLMTRDFKVEQCPAESRALFSHLQAETRYGASVFWFREGTLPRAFLDAWQVKRDGNLRGILEVG